MSDHRIPAVGCKPEPRCVCVETNRIMDSCRDRDCYENVRVFLTDLGEDIIEHTSQIRVKSAAIAWTYIGIDPVQFNRGFYTVHIRFYIKLVLEGCICPGRSQEFDGIAVLEKQVVLFGGDSGVSIFRSDVDSAGFCAEPEPCYKERSLPTAVIEAVDPIVLGVRVLEPACHEPVCCCCCACDVPPSITACLSAPLCGCHGHEHGHDHDHCHEHDGGCERDNGRRLVVSLGIFSLVRLVRPAQYLIHATDFVIPDKECVSAKPDDPCELFRSMAFPIAEFAPASLPPALPDRNRCGCGNG